MCGIDGAKLKWLPYGYIFSGIKARQIAWGPRMKTTFWKTPIYI